jgi:hypothetical protein
LTFAGFASHTTIKIFTVSGHWVRTLPPSDESVTWDLKNDRGEPVASGLYIYLATDDQGQKATGRFAIVR